MKSIIKNKKGVSIMIGYVLLIVGIMGLSAIVYVWLTSYIPRELPECPDGVSLSISEKELKQNGNGYELTLNIRNTGRFSVNGFYIRATLSEQQEIATEDLSVYLDAAKSDVIGSMSLILFKGEVLPTGETAKAVFNLNKQIYSIEIIPFRYETIDGKNFEIVCGEARIRETIRVPSGSGDADSSGGENLPVAVDTTLVTINLSECDDDLTPSLILTPILPPTP